MKIIIQAALIAILASTTTGYAIWPFDVAESKQNVLEKNLYTEEVIKPTIKEIKRILDSDIKIREEFLESLKTGQPRVSRTKLDPAKWTWLELKTQDPKTIEKDIQYLKTIDPEIFFRNSTTIVDDAYKNHQNIGYSLDITKNQIKYDYERFENVFQKNWPAINVTNYTLRQTTPNLWHQFKNWWNRRSYDSSSFAPVLVNKPKTIRPIVWKNMQRLKKTVQQGIGRMPAYNIAPRTSLEAMESAEQHGLGY